MRAPRIAIEHIAPQVDGARYMVKGIVGQALRIEADVFMDGHAQLAVQVLWQEANGKPVSHAMEAFGNDRWRTSVTPLRPVRHAAKEFRMRCQMPISPAGSSSRNRIITTPNEA